jgi:predicted DNA binding CopG/RHH family protein
MATATQKNQVLNFKVSEHLKNAISKSAERAGLPPSAFIREIIKKYIKYKEPEIL